MHRRLLLSLASVSFVGLSVVGLQPLVPRTVSATGLPGPAEVPLSSASEGAVGVVVVLEPVDEPPEARLVGASKGTDEVGRSEGRLHRVVAKMQDGSMRHAVLAAGPELQVGESVRGAGGTLVARELYRSAPFIPVRERS